MEEEIIVNQGPLVDSDVLNEYDISKERTINLNYADEIKDVINSVFTDFGVDALISGHIAGPNVIRFGLNTGKNVSVKSIANLINDIQIRLGGVAVRLDTTSKGMYDIGLEVETKVHELVGFRSVYESLPNIKKHPLAVPLGVKATEEPVWIDLEEAPHILISGTTGSGKSMLLKSMIMSLVMRNLLADVQLVLFDPKMVEFNCFKDLPHLYCPIIKNKDNAYKVLSNLEQEMYDRYSKMSETSCCNLEEYNEYAIQNGLEKLPYIVLIFDEYGDLVDQKKEVASIVVSLAQKARAAGIHIIISVQNPSTYVVTGVLKANLPVHIALMTSSVTDSLVILGEAGAEKLSGRGDMFVQSHLLSKLGVMRLQGCFVDRNEIKRVMDFITPRHLKPTTVVQAESNNQEDDLYQKIKEWATNEEYVSVSRIQRECGMGFNRASRYFSLLQQDGIVSSEATKKGYKVIKNR